jgi:hypothetical protein
MSLAVPWTNKLCREKKRLPPDAGTHDWLVPLLLPHKCWIRLLVFLEYVSFRILGYLTFLELTQPMCQGMALFANIALCPGHRPLSLLK